MHVFDHRNEMNTQKRKKEIPFHWKEHWLIQSRREQKPPQKKERLDLCMCACVLIRLHLHLQWFGPFRITHLFVWPFFYYFVHLFAFHFWCFHGNDFIMSTFSVKFFASICPTHDVSHRAKKKKQKNRRRRGTYHIDSRIIWNEMMMMYPQKWNANKKKKKRNTFDILILVERK